MLNSLTHKNGPPSHSARYTASNPAPPAVPSRALNTTYAAGACTSTRRSSLCRPCSTASSGPSPVAPSYTRTVSRCGSVSTCRNTISIACASLLPASIDQLTCTGASYGPADSAPCVSRSTVCAVRLSSSRPTRKERMLLLLPLLLFSASLAPAIAAL